MLVCRKLKPIRISTQGGIGEEHLDGIKRGIRRVLIRARVAEHIKLNEQWNWRDSDYCDENKTLMPYKSLEWHINMARGASKVLGHLNAKILLNSFLEDPSYKTDIRYDLAIVNEPLHWSSDDNRIVIGVGRDGQGAVISIAYFTDFLLSAGEDPKKNSEFQLMTQMLVMHEFGHVFGLFPGNGKIKPTDEELRDTHCQNDCVMFWRIELERSKRIQSQPFCNSCIVKLKEYFENP